jgi:hypothetical protein
MSTHQDRVRDALDLCKKHLDATRTRNTEIEAYLTAFLLVYTYANLEAAAKECIQVRSGHITDPRAQAFVAASWEELWRGLKVTELGKFIGRYDEDCRDRFIKGVTSDDRHVAYSNLLENRHLAAHAATATMTFLEFEHSYEKCFAVIDEFGGWLDDQIEVMAGA